MALWVAIAPRKEVTRVIAMRGAEQIVLKACLRSDPQHWKALPTLLEAIAFWEGSQVRAALIADDASTASGSALFREAFDDFGRSALYVLDVVWDHHRDPGPDQLSGLGDFSDLCRLLLNEVAR